MVRVFFLLYRSDYEKGISKVLIGIRDKENIQNLIKPKSFNGQGLSCIIDQNGNVVISPLILNHLCS